MKRALVVGGYGTFGVWVCRDLVKFGVPITVAGRDLKRAEALARTLGPDHDAAVIDLAKPETIHAALQGRTVAANCAGPFQEFDPTFLEACIESGCHYADIADDRGYAAMVRKHGPRFAERGLAAVGGCSSLPAISGALALKLRAKYPTPPVRVRVTLFIGNDNPKGTAAVTSLIGHLGQPILTVGQSLRGGHGREFVPLPAPFGPSLALDFNFPEYDLFPALLGVRDLRVKVGFELRLGTEIMAWLATTGLRFGRRTAEMISWSGKFTRRYGCSGGAVMTEFFFADGSTHRAALVTAVDGQRMAALPCAVVAHALYTAPLSRVGACTAYELLGEDNLLLALQTAMPELRLELH